MSFTSARMISAAISISLLILLVPTAQADEVSDREAQSILHMLDYLGVDYGGSVLFGKILNEVEYQEQAEFAAQSLKLISSLPEHPLLPNIIKDAQKLSADVGEKAPAEEVSAEAQQLRKKIISAYNIPVSPKRVPDSQRAAVLYQQLCVRCHGSKGYGDGAESKTLNPKPANFRDATRMGKRSVYGLYSTISLGVPGTAMAGFPQLTDDERWGLAFLAANFHNLPERLDLGRRLWEKRDFHGAIPNMVTLTTLTANEVSINYGDNTRAVFEYLRAKPSALITNRHATLIFATNQLDNAMARYQAGDRSEAQRYAIAAYLEGFEPMEISLVNLNTQLRLDIEREMMAIRKLIYDGAPVAALSVKIESAKQLLRQADELLREGKLSISGAFISSLFVLLREGLESILVLAAVIAFVVKSGQRNALIYIHAGWGGALILGILTWMAATMLVDISGAGREITSGVTALIASAMLIYVGFWLHDKTHARAWQKFLKDKVGAALEKKTVWALALISFFAVYREIFETVLFYQALWAQTTVDTRPALWSGMLTAGMTLLAIGWGLFRFGIRLPLNAFFSATSILLAIMAVIFAGQGVASLQDAGIVETSPVNFVSLPMLGVLPTTETLLTQLAVIGILFLCYRIPIRQQHNTQTDNPPVSRA
ncbi:MAG: cytochrome c/FTR1 family iron permease [Pseudomonadota bacterium]